MHAAARVLGNDKGEDAAMVRRRFDGLVAAMRRHRDQAGALASAIEHFAKVTRSYRPGLFHGFCNGSFVVKLRVHPLAGFVLLPVVGARPPHDAS